jgi:hypothetical protein
VKEAQKGACSSEYYHYLVQVVAKEMKLWCFVKLPVFKDQWQKFYGENDGVTGDAEDHFSEHRVHIGVPEGKPAPDGLTDLQE